MSNVLPAPRAILFDWDNTLADNWASVCEGLNAAFEAFGLETWTVEQTRARVRESMRDRFPRLFGENWLEARDIFYEAFRKSHLNTLRAMPGADLLLRGLARKGLYLGVVSNKNGDLLRRETAHLGWNGYFGRVVGATDAEQDKPAPDPVYLALAESGVSAGPAVWFVGDTAIDMQCARASGCTAILLGHTIEEGGPADIPEPDVRVADCEELLGLVANPRDAHMTT